MLPQTIEDLEKVRSSCKAMVRKRAALSGGASMIPVLGADMLADVGMLTELIPAINRKFGLTPDQIDALGPKDKVLVYKLITAVGAGLVGRYITKELVLVALKNVGVRMAAKQVVKYVPLAGQAVAAVIGFGAMMHLGNSHIDECYEVAKGAIEK
jgi:uncharacterized protein (DUF697 family)